jgi:hypothetical protein
MSKFGTLTIQFGRLKLMVTAPEQDVRASTCKFKVLAPNGRVLAQDEQLGIFQPEYVDLDRDGVPELIVATDSGGSGGYCTSYILSQKGKPRLLQKIADSYAAHAVDDDSGYAGPDYAVETGDLVFNSFDGLCNACSPRPAMYLQLRNGQFVDVSSHFKAEYDREIEELRRKLAPSDLRRFRSAKTSQDDAYAEAFVTKDTAQTVLKILLDYLYSGREQRAHAYLREAWPAFDQQRVWKEIIETRAGGILEQISR